MCSTTCATRSYERLQRLDFASHDQMQTGQLVSRANSDVALLQGLLMFLPIMLGNLVMLVLSIVVMAYLSPPLTIVALLMVPGAHGRRVPAAVDASSPRVGMHSSAPAKWPASSTKPSPACAS